VLGVPGEKDRPQNGKNSICDLLYLETAISRHEGLQMLDMLQVSRSIGILSIYSRTRASDVTDRIGCYRPHWVLPLTVNHPCQRLEWCEEWLNWDEEWNN
jgi:hypothetical protein